MIHDFMGREIKANDTIVYPVRRGSEMWMCEMRVTQVTKDYIKGYNPTGRINTIRNLKNVVKVEPRALTEGE